MHIQKFVQNPPWQIHIRREYSSIFHMQLIHQFIDKNNGLAKILEENSFFNSKA